MNPTLVSAFVGVALGSAGSLLGQYLGIRASARQARAARVDARRDELKHVIRDFLQAAQDTEEWAIARFEKGKTPEGARTRNLWFAQKYVQIFGPPELGETSLNYTIELNRLLWDGSLQSDRNFWDEMAAARNPFLAAASRALDVSKPL